MTHMFYPDVAVAGTSLTAATDNTTLASTWVDIGQFGHVMFIVSTTDASADTTVDAKLQSADDSSGTNAADITGKAITQFTAAATQKTAVLFVRADEVNAGDTHVGCTVTAGNGTVGATTNIVALGFPTNYSPASDYDAATVVEIVS